MIKVRRLAGLLVCGCLSWAGPAWAVDAVVHWNEITVAAVTVGRPGPIGSLDIALVQAAVYDAVQAIDRRFKPYHVTVPGASGSPAAAAATAAHNVLVGLYPGQAVSLTPTYQAYLVSNNLVNDPGVAVGQQVAVGFLALRRLDPNPLPPPFIGGTRPGEWRPTESFIGGPPPGPPPSGAAMAFPWLGAVTPFTLKSSTQFRAVKPPRLNSAHYAHDYDEVKALGARFNSARTAEQTDIAYFYAGNFFAMWNQGLRAIAEQQVHNIGDSARLFALANLATADAVITSWDSKLHFNFWRPLTAIREGDNDGNRHTAGDSTWEPLINTPNYPDYTSGANNVTGAVTRSLELFFGTDEMTFSLTSAVPQAVQKTRTYTRFSDAAEDVVDARVLLGIHFRFADTAARKQGRQVAKWAFKHFLRPVDDHDAHDDDNDD